MHCEVYNCYLHLFSFQNIQFCFWWEICEKCAVLKVEANKICNILDQKRKEKKKKEKTFYLSCSEKAVKACS